jgi:hypothetical protein
VAPVVLLMLKNPMIFHIRLLALYEEWTGFN